jgi:hypothetical protein
MQNSQQVLSQKTQELIIRLVLGKFSIPQVARITGISEQIIKTQIKF